MRHFVASIHFDEVSEEQIVTSAYFMQVNPSGPDHWGRYRDTHRMVEGESLITSRKVRVDTMVEGSFLEPLLGRGSATTSGVRGDS
jgi:hypothetical protein